MNNAEKRDARRVFHRFWKEKKAVERWQRENPPFLNVKADRKRGLRRLIERMRGVSGKKSDNR